MTTTHNTCLVSTDRSSLSCPVMEAYNLDRLCTALQCGQLHHIKYIYFVWFKQLFKQTSFIIRHAKLDLQTQCFHCTALFLAPGYNKQSLARVLCVQAKVNEWESICLASHNLPWCGQRVSKGAICTNWPQTRFSMKYYWYEMRWLVIVSA